ncbi:MAG: hypothetical protein Q4D62_10830 [Planctomycetia bacterium]|nr:hypothetical protein [Planctomycetia bacterium]
MSAISVRTLDFFDRYNIKKIVEKYGFDEKTALRKFILSETYRMLVDKELELYTVSPEIIFDMWEAEQVTGNPRNSLYLRRDEYV